jgi:exo-1,4-beta-D-glucosaminidase
MRTLSLSLTMMALASLAHAGAAVLPLAEGWRLQSSATAGNDGAALSAPGVDTTTWYPTSVPRTVLAALVDNQVYPDPYYGLNLKQIPGYRDELWLVMPEDSPFRNPWWYRTTFTPPADWAGKHITLHFDGINYEANIWLNGTLVAGKDTVRGMFRRFEFPVSGQVKLGTENVLAVEIIPPGLVENKNYNTKQIEATTGWDDHNPQPPDLNMGLWQGVSLRAQGPVTLRHPYVETQLQWPADGANPTAQLTVSAYLHNTSDAQVTGVFRTTVDGQPLEQHITLDANETREVFFRPAGYPALQLASPRLWWPHPLGPANLYDASAAFSIEGVESDAAQWRFGIREITTYINDEDWRVYKVNGQDLLIRGGAWMTTDMLLRFSPERYEALIRYAREANLNMLRSEGFSVRETDTFYDLCDELGVMATQQIFGRSIPDEDLAIACIDDTFLRIRNHPSLVHFLGHDETFPTERLDAAYKDMIAKYRLNRTYQPHSGTFTVPTRAKTGGTRTGSRELWTYASPAHYYHRTFDGAWGFAQSGGIGGIVAAPDSLRQMMPADQLWPALGTEAWSFHTVTQGAEYFDAVLVAMRESYGEAADLDDFLRKIYAMNYDSARGMFEAYGRNKPKATGLTTWKYDAAWPAAMTWQYIDWYLRPTAAYYGAKKACQTLHVQYAYDDNTVYVVNNQRAPLEGLQVTATRYALDGTQLGQQSATVAVGNDGVAAAFVVDPVAAEHVTSLLALTLTRADGAVVSRNVYWLSLTPDIPGTTSERSGEPFRTKPKSRADFKALAGLPAAAVTAAATRTQQDGEHRVTVQLTNPGPGIAFQLHATLHENDTAPEAAPAYWDDNYITLLPGETRLVGVTLPEAALPGESPVVRVSGWNTPVTVAPWVAP